MFSFTPKTHKQDLLDNSEMICLLGSSVDNEQVNIDLLKFGAVDINEEFSQEQVGSFVADASVHRTNAITEPLSVISSPLNNNNFASDSHTKDQGDNTKFFNIDSIEDEFYDDAYLDDFAAQDGKNLFSGAIVDDHKIKNETLFVGLGKIGADDKEAHVNYETVDDDDNQDDLSNKVEQVGSEDHPPKAVILDKDEALREAKSQKRASVQVNDILNLTKEKKSKTKFALIAQSLYNVQKDEDNLLSNEKEVFGKIEAEDFITGNVTVLNQGLRTGTDNVVIASPDGSDDSLDDKEGKERIHEVEYSSNSPSCSITLSLPNDAHDHQGPRLLPLLLRDFGVHWFTYGLAIVVCLLCLLKVYQVQQTRDLTARLNEVVVTNADLEKQWLILVASRQKLSEHSKIRSLASESLGMVSPKTENEKVISLNKR